MDGCLVDVSVVDVVCLCDYECFVCVLLFEVVGIVCEGLDIGFFVLIVVVIMFVEDGDECFCLLVCFNCDYVKVFLCIDVGFGSGVWI